MDMRQPTGMRGRSSELRQAAYEMRHNLTPAEERLWQAIRYRQVDGLRFRCQHAVERFILDFYCASHRFGIEVDGGVHIARTIEDQLRTEHLNTLGIAILRVSNDAVLSNIDQVILEIRNFASARPSRFNMIQTAAKKTTLLFPRLRGLGGVPATFRFPRLRGLGGDYTPKFEGDCPPLRELGNTPTAFRFPRLRGLGGDQPPRRLGGS